VCTVTVLIYLDVDAASRGTLATENQCVVCGEKDNYVKYNVVPHFYRTFFPAKLKTHWSHDCLLLCHRVLQLAP